MSNGGVESSVPLLDILHITQPTLSRQITELEEEIGAQLLQRGKRRTTLTEAGMLFRRRAQQMVDLSEIARQEVDGSGGDLRGTVSIGSAETAAAEVFPDPSSPSTPRCASALSPAWPTRSRRGWNGGWWISAC